MRLGKKKSWKAVQEFKFPAKKAVVCWSTLKASPCFGWKGETRVVGFSVITQDISMCNSIKWKISAGAFPFIWSSIVCSTYDAQPTFIPKTKVYLPKVGVWRESWHCAWGAITLPYCQPPRHKNQWGWWPGSSDSKEIKDVTLHDFWYRLHCNNESFTRGLLKFTWISVSACPSRVKAPWSIGLTSPLTSSWRKCSATSSSSQPCSLQQNFHQ